MRRSQERAPTSGDSPPSPPLRSPIRERARGWREGYFLLRLVALVATVVLPLATLLVAEVYRNERHEEQAAMGRLDDRAQAAVREAQGVVSRGEQLLQFLASRDDLKRLEPKTCTGLLGGVLELDRHYANLVLLRPDGSVVCASEPAAAPVSFAGQPWLPAALASRGVTLAGPMTGLLRGRKVLRLCRPVLDAGGHPVGVLVVALDLHQLSAALATPDRAPLETVSVLRADRVVLAHQPDPERWIGRVDPGPPGQPRPGLGAEWRVGTGMDGVERAYASQTIDHGLLVAVGMPVGPLLAQSHARIAWHAALVALVGLGALLLAIWGARRLTRPLNSLTATTRRLAAGAADVRADEGLPAEFGEVAHEFNRLVNLQQAVHDQLRDGERHMRRLRNFYEALSSTNQALVRRPDPAVLYDEVCRICVATRLADMAWIGLRDGDAVRAVAWGGTAREYTEGLRIELDDPQRQGPIARAFRSGLPITANHYLSDPSTRAWHDRAARFDVRSSAAFPFHLDGQVVGSLNLYVSVENYFDDEMVILLTAMTHDLSLGLDAARQEQARAAMLEAEAANRAKTTFLSNVSHELRTPLNAILGFTQLLQMRVRDGLGEEARQQLDNVYLAASQLRALIDDVMDVTSIEAGRVSLEFEDVVLEGLLEEALRLCEPLAARTGVTLQLHLPVPAGTRIRTDPVRLRQVLLNLLTNAIKYNRPEGRVDLSLEADASTLTLRIRDTGIGMSPEQLASLYQPFNRLGREHTAVEGSGIGLNLTRQLVGLFEGTMEVTSQVGVGTEVTLRLPRGAPVRALAARPRDRVGPAAPTEGTGAPRGRVLYIEDNPVNAVLMEHLLRAVPGIELAVAPTGTEGLAAIRKERPDLVLLDMNLPDMSGLDVLEALRHDPALRRCRVIALSASALQEDMRAAFDAGAVAYWTKPIDFVEVVQGVQAAIEVAGQETDPDDDDGARPAATEAG